MLPRRLAAWLDPDWAFPWSAISLPTKFSSSIDLRSCSFRKLWLELELCHFQLERVSPPPREDSKWKRRPPIYPHFGYLWVSIAMWARAHRNIHGFLTETYSGLRSRCQMPWRWRNARDWRISYMIFAVNGSFNPFSSRAKLYKSPPIQYGWIDF
jgi:hypothetical protein